MKQSTLAKGTILLTVTTLFSKFIGSLFRIPLQNIAGDEVFGIFSMVYPIYMVALILSVAGIPLAISKLIAEANDRNDLIAIHKIHTTGKRLAILFGFLSFIIILFFSDVLAALLGGSQTKLALLVVSSTLLIAPYMAVYRGYFQGFGNMQPTSISQVIEQLIRVNLMILLAFFLVSKGYSDEKIAGWMMLGSFFGAACSLLYLIKVFYRNKPIKPSKSHYSLSVWWVSSIKILKLSIPIAFGAITMALLHFVDALTIPSGLRTIGFSPSEINYSFGLYSRGTALIQITTVLASAMILPLIPELTKKRLTQSRQNITQTITQPQLFIRLTAWPAAFMITVLALPINLSLFTDINGSFMLATIGFSSVFTSFAILGTGILQGINLAKEAAWIIMISVFLKAALNLYFIQNFGVEGAAVATLLIYMLIVAMNTYILFQNKIGIIHFKQHLLIIFSAFIVAMIIYLPTLALPIDKLSRFSAFFYVCLAIIIGSILYTFLLFLFKIINFKTISSLLYKTRRKS
ncbi:oligosaccharide flippase family protein [Ornithinibacillus sp. 4-3]|uniref:Oligosaccharide flippase family protein n=1 Tax=Ornithinibacillus sp. 4-3 TaxID=3231488 RepID=A0AB39HN40_9BACI